MSARESKVDAVDQIMDWFRGWIVVGVLGCSS